MGHRGACAFGRHDLGAVDQRVAIAMIAIVMGVEQGADFRAAGAGESVQHRARMGIIEHRVDQQRLAAVGDKPGIRQAPTAIGLQIGERPVAESGDARFIARLGKRKRHSPLNPPSTASTCPVI
jgi:hypothetical protein